jgi:hypothetical protein
VFVGGESVEQTRCTWLRAGTGWRRESAVGLVRPGRDTTMYWRREDGLKLRPIAFGPE